MRVCLTLPPLLLRSAGVKTYVYYWARSLLAAAGSHALELFPFIDGASLPDECVHDRSVLAAGKL